MDWQLPAVLLLVIAAAGYLARRTWRTWAGKKAGCGGCSCARGDSGPQPAQDGTFIPADQLTRRLPPGPQA